jgi:hypothetical protein
VAWASDITHVHRFVKEERRRAEKPVAMTCGFLAAAETLFWRTSNVARFLFRRHDALALARPFTVTPA